MVLCTFHYHKESLCCGWHRHSTLVLLWQVILLPHLQGHSSLALVPPKIPTQALGWEFSQNIEAMSHLKSLGHREKEEECLAIVMDPVYSKVL